MNQRNLPTSFSTQHGSRYDIDEGQGMQRVKYYGGVSVNPNKSVFYGDEKTTERCLDASGECDNYVVKDYKFGSVMIQFFKDHRCIYQGHLQLMPEAGLYPVDMILLPDGRSAQDDRFHVGDRIV